MRVATLLIVGAMTASLAAAVQPVETYSQATVLVADSYFWTGPEGNLGVEITGKFNTEAGLQDTLWFDTEIGRFKDR